MRFEWDENKNAINKQKHGISFETAKLVFFDPHRKEYYDEEHSTLEEDRWITIGKAGKILFVVYVEREYGNVIRLISARKAKAEERRDYYGNGES